MGVGGTADRGLHVDPADWDILWKRDVPMKGVLPRMPLKHSKKAGKESCLRAICASSTKTLLDAAPTAERRAPNDRKNTEHERQLDPRDPGERHQCLE